MTDASTHLLARLRFRHLQLIAQIEHTGSMSRAAVALNLSQPALSKSLKEIEDMLGFSVFHRGARGLQKTRQGAVLIEGASVLLKDLLHLQAEAQAAGDLAALLRIGTSAFLAVRLLPPVVARLATMDPPVFVRLREDNVPRLFEELRNGDLDALVTLYNQDAMDAARNVQFERLATERYVVIAPADHPLGKAGRCTWHRLAAESWVSTVRPSFARIFLEDMFRQHGVSPPAPRCETDGPLTAARLVAEGAGFSCVPESAALELVRLRSISIIEVEGALPVIPIGLFYRHTAANHPRIALLRQALFEQRQGT